MQTRSIATCIILTLVTCGIYGIYWMVVLTNEANALSQHQNQTSGGMVILLTIITCGIYGLYWAYFMGEKLDLAASQRGLMVQNRGVVYLILQLVFAIAGLALMQSAVNEILTTHR